MKLNKKWLFIGLLSISICSISTVALTSCSNSKNAVKKDTNKINLSFDNFVNQHCVSSILWQKSIYDWQNDFQNGNFYEFVNGLNEINSDSIKETGFEFNSSTSATIIPLNSISSNPIFINALATFKNNNEILEIEIDNLLVFTSNNLQKPNLDLINKGPIVINQVDLPSISNTNPNLVTDQEWTKNINNISPNGYYIPNTIYYLHSKEYISANVYQLIYKINDQYIPILNESEFPDIIFNINVSPNIDKQIVTNFELNIDDINKFFPNMTKLDILDLNSINVFNSLNNYVNSLPEVHSLMNCVDSQSNSVYNYAIYNQEITNSILITFSSNPNLENETIYFYKFILKF